MPNEFGRVGKGNAIAIVEDDAEMRSMLEEFLMSHGYEVHGYSSAAEFLRVTGAAKRCFSLVISDVHTPHGSGFDLLQSLRDSGAKLPVLLMTAAPNAKDEARASALEAGAYLEKPFSLQELLTRIRASSSRVVA